MTQNARQVLEDCRQALEEIKDGVMGRQWRIRWVAAVALLRTVGYVLKEVDSSNDRLLKQIIKEEWENLKQTRPQPTIFWEFIGAERHNIIHQYKITAGQGVTIRPGTMYIDLKTGHQSSGPSLPTLYNYTINEGSYKGLDQREVLQEAIDWWEKYLDRIDKDYHERKSLQGS
jgi:hypothetical protein